MGAATQPDALARDTISRKKINIPLPNNIDASIDDASNKEGHAVNAEINEPTAEQPGNIRPVNDVIEKLTKHSFDNEEKWSYLVHWYDTDNSHDTWEPQVHYRVTQSSRIINGTKFRYRRASIMLEMVKRRMTSL